MTEEKVAAAPAGARVWDVDPYDEDILRDPYAYYTELREHGGIVWLSRYGIWAVGRQEDVRDVFSDWRRFCSSRGVGLTDFKTEAPWRQPSIILEVDPPEHRKARKVMTEALSPQAVSSLRDGFCDAAETLVDELLQRGSFDAVPELAEAFTLEVFPDAVGLGPEDRRNLLVYGNMVFNALGPDNRLRQEALAHGATVVPWITERCGREALKSPGLGATIYEAADAGDVTHEEAGLLVRSLLSAGVDTTVAGLGGAALAFAENPAQWQLFRENEALHRTAFDELLRYYSPVHSFCRTSAIDTEVGGVPVAEGQKVLCVLAAANRDPEFWDRPDELDVERRTRGHVAFGVGLHSCVGQVIARLEAEVLLGTMARKVKSLELDGEPEWQPGNSMRTLKSLPLRMTAA